MKHDVRLLPKSVDGQREATWIVADYIDVVLHIFTPGCARLLPARGALGRRAVGRGRLLAGRASRAARGTPCRGAAAGTRGRLGVPAIERARLLQRAVAAAASASRAVRNGPSLRRISHEGNARARRRRRARSSASVGMRRVRGSGSETKTAADCAGSLPRARERDGLARVALRLSRPRAARRGRLAE